MVGNSNDSGPGSLRQAIIDAAPGDTIQFDMSSGHVTSPIILTTGELSIVQNLNIEGPGADLLAISGNQASRVFNISTSVTASITDLTIMNGGTALKSDSAGWGGGVLSYGSLSLTSCAIANNATDYFGGGIYNLGSATVTNCTISGNSSAEYDGGGIWNNGSLTLTNSTIANNSAESGGGGGIENYGTMVATDCTIGGNSAHFGGGIDNGDPGSATLANTIIAGCPFGPLERLSRKKSGCLRSVSQGAPYAPPLEVGAEVRGGREAIRLGRTTVLLAP